MTYRTYRLLIISLGLLVVFAVALVCHQHVRGFSLKNSDRVSCNTGSSTANTLSIQLIIPIKISQLLTQLCHSERIQSYFSEVEISWRPRNLVTGADIMSTRYDVVMGRSHSFNGLLPNFSDYYARLFELSGYPVYWFAQNTYDLADPSVLSVLKIGLVDDPLSHTHYLIPLNYLTTHAGDSVSLNLTYYPDTYALYQSFIDNEVDIISSVEPFSEQLQRPVFKTLIRHADVGSLFINRNLPAQVQCELSKTLRIVTDHLKVTLHLESSKLRLESVCDN